MVAFAVGEQYEVGNGFNIIAAHTDSPCLKVKPESKVEKEGFLQLGVSTYGGGLWHTWFDRDLAIAGRVIVRNKNGSFDHRLVHLNRPVCRIPTLAIHLSRTVNSEGFKFDTEDQLMPILASVTKGVLEGADHKAHHHPVLLKAIATELKCNVTDICDFELCLADHQPATIGGLQDEFVFSPRLDNLMCCWTSLQALLKSLPTLERDSRVRAVAFFDHEEVGSQSMNGAKSEMLDHALDRINEAMLGEALSANMASVSRRNSFLISADMAHACHPNYASKHEANHKPRMHAGMVLKTNVNQSYATTTQSAFLIQELARERNIPIQSFVVKNSTGCGSTIGPMSSAAMGMRTADMGIAQLSMHSIREMCATTDVDHSLNLFEAFFNIFTTLDKKLDMQ